MDDDFDDDEECWSCDGEGVIYSCVSEYACIDPEGGCDLCERRCLVCRPLTPAEREERAKMQAVMRDALNTDSTEPTNG
jgi:hypothetical protein